ncbi:hypothetical protein [Xenorhabdus indica]|uniref:hypothetical protein n=1 Tax=Xenorhabdus indica TaxID=333964 RepID=UPI001CA4548F|nr:hypothetical protein [Xenorhabdus indica]MBC8944973.1 hypothetical protein [Xenorhabdus indica]
MNVPGLYFIGAPMQVNDPDAASGFVHGFRGNIQALGHIIAEKYHGMAIKPIFKCKISLTHPSDGLTALTEFLVEFVSTTMSLFELFGYLGVPLLLKRMTIKTAYMHVYGHHFHENITTNVGKIKKIVLKWYLSMDSIGMVMAIFRHIILRYQPIISILRKVPIFIPYFMFSAKG